METPVCAICLLTPTNYHVFDCGHGGCAGCVLRWITRTPQCHACRRDVTLCIPVWHVGSRNTTDPAVAALEEWNAAARIGPIRMRPEVIRMMIPFVGPDSEAWASDDGEAESSDTEQDNPPVSEPALMAHFETAFRDFMDAGRHDPDGRTRCMQRARRWATLVREFSPEVTDLRINVLFDHECVRPIPPTLPARLAAWYLFAGVPFEHVPEPLKYKTSIAITAAFCDPQFPVTCPPGVWTDEIVTIRLCKWGGVPSTCLARGDFLSALVTVPYWLSLLAPQFEKETWRRFFSLRLPSHAQTWVGMTLPEGFAADDVAFWVDLIARYPSLVFRIPSDQTSAVLHRVVSAMPSAYFSIPLTYRTPELADLVTHLVNS